MTLPTARGLARLVAPLALTALGAFPALAQDCWLPDAFEPNDVVPVTIVPGVYDGLHTSGYGIDAQRDIDRFRVDVPPLQRLVVEFDIAEPDGGVPSHNTDGLFGWIGPEDESEPARPFNMGLDLSVASPSVFDNVSLQTVSVVFSVESDPHHEAGCRDYDMTVRLEPRPCDVLADDALEGPDDCAIAAVLPVGLHDDLIVFNERRAAGRDFDVYRIPSVAPGDWFEVVLLDDANNGNHLDLEVFAGSDCSGPRLLGGFTVFEINDSANPQDYTVRVSTDDTAGFEKYALNLRSADCASTTPDALEPNDACGSYAPITPGTYSLTLTDGDVDGFVVSVPPDFTFRARVDVDAIHQRVRVDGALAPQCPTSATGQNDYWFAANQGPTPLDYHVRVASADGTCARYSLSITLEPIQCSPTDIAENEPNDDCQSATPLSFAYEHLYHEFALVPGDVDYFRVTVPAGETRVLYLSGLGSQVLNNVRLTVIPEDAGCSGPGRRIEHPRTGWDFSKGPETLLNNRTEADRDFLLRVEQTGTPSGCEVYAIAISTNTWTGDHDFDSCVEAAPISEVRTAGGTLSHGVSTFSSAVVEPGQTLYATSDNNIFQAYVPLELRFHDGPADCAVGGATLGTVRREAPLEVEHQYDPTATLQGRYTNTTSAAKLVIVEVAQDDDCGQWLPAMTIRLELSPGPTHSTFCHGNLTANDRIICPCGNLSEVGDGQGCVNSTGTGGRLDADGSNSLALSDWTPRVEDLPPNVPFVLIGSEGGGPVYLSFPRTFMDGRLCLGAGVEPVLTGTTNANGSWVAPAPLPSLVGGLTPGGALALQAWYRDPAGPCGAASNLTNGIAVEWQ